MVHDLGAPLASLILAVSPERIALGGAIALGLSACAEHDGIVR